MKIRWTGSHGPSLSSRWNFLGAARDCIWKTERRRCGASGLWTDEKPKVPTFTNPVLTGADPDILLHEGRYYIYNRVPNDPNSREDAYLLQNGEHAGLDRMGDANAIFRVAWSDDLVNWSPYHPVLYRDKSLQGAYCLSHNVLEYK